MTENRFRQDWHIHTEASYDGLVTCPELKEIMKANGITQFGVTEHVSYPFMIEYLKKSRELYDRNKCEGFHFGVELSTVSKYLYEYTLTRNFGIDTKLWFGLPPEYVHPGYEGHDPVVIPITEEELRELRVEYVICAAHYIFNGPEDRQSLIRSWHEQQMVCATDSRVDIVGHPWCMPFRASLDENFYPVTDANGMATGEPWFDDFHVIPGSMHDEFATALLENGKCAELNMSFYNNPAFTEKFKYQYMEYIRMLFEKGVPITTGTDFHGDPGCRYEGYQEGSEKYLKSVGFTEKDFAIPKFRTYSD